MAICPSCGESNSDDNKFCVNCGCKLENMGKVCPNCGYGNAEGSKFCVNCGNNLEAAVKFCTNCGYQNEEGAKFCVGCGNRLEDGGEVSKKNDDPAFFAHVFMDESGEVRMEVLGDGKDETSGLSGLVKNDSAGELSKGNLDSKPFKFLDDLIHSGDKKIILENNIELFDNEKDIYKDGIKLDVYGLVIDGNGLTIDAKSEASIFEISEKVTLKNFIFKNAYSSGHGGAITIEGSTTFENCTFENNKGFIGGAIHNISGESKIQSCTFDGNISSSGDGGGAILNESTRDFKITDSVFNNNVADNYGGAIDNINNARSWGPMTLENCEFSNNSSRNGGAIRNFRASEIVLDSCNFIENNAIAGGGAIHNDEAPLSVRGCNFEANEAKEGGAIKNFLKDINLKNSVFKNNLSENGGAIYNLRCELSLENCEFVSPEDTVKDIKS